MLRVGYASHLRRPDIAACLGAGSKQNPPNPDGTIGLGPKLPLLGCAAGGVIS